MSTKSISVACLTSQAKSMSKRKADDADVSDSAPKRVRLTFGEAVSMTNLAPRTTAATVINGLTIDILEQLKHICCSIENKKQIVVAENGRDGRVSRVENSKLAENLDIEDLNFVEKCQVILRKNVESIRGVGKVPYEFFEPALQRCTAQQLEKFELNNPIMVGRSEALWKRHALRDYAIAVLDGFHSWKKLWSSKTADSQRKFENSLNRFRQSSTRIASGVRQSLVIEPLPLRTTRVASRNAAFKVTNSKPLAMPPKPLSRK